MPYPSENGLYHLPQIPAKAGAAVAAASKNGGKKPVVVQRWFSQLSGVTFRVKTQSPTRISALLDLRSQVKPPSTKVVILFSFSSEGHTAHTAHTISQVLVPDGLGFNWGVPLIPKRRGPEAVYQSIGSRCKVFSGSGASKSPIPGRKKITAVTI